MICPNCATNWPDELRGVMKYCGACGKTMEPEVLLPSGAPEAEIEPGGELRYMTVVFADLAGFTAFAEDRSPDDVAQIVGDLLQRLGRVVERNSGAVDKFLGDAVVATFGLLQPVPTAARNAVRAGLEMQEEAAAFNAEYGFSFGLRVGIHAGQAMFRSIGGSWTVMGDTVNTASRIQSVAAPGKVWISRPVYEEVRRYFTFDLRPAIELKGKKHTIQPYEVIAVRTIPLIELPPFVGREQEWALIQSELAQALQTQSLRMMLVRGAAGVGKSRLIWELREWAQQAGQLFRLDVIQYDHSVQLPSHGLNTLLRNRFNLPLELSESEVLEQFKQRMLAVYPGVPAGREMLAVEFFAFVLGILHPDFQIASMDGGGKWNNAFLEIKDWLESEARTEPWIIIIEDAQKGDADTAAFFESILALEKHAPIFVLVTVREEDFGPESYWYQPVDQWVKAGLITELRLRELPAPVLAKALMAMDSCIMTEDLALRIAEHTEGNPLFATELVLLICDQGISEPEKMPLPTSVHEVMEARLERLGLAGKEVAKRGALVGRRFTLDAVGRIWERARPELSDGVRVLQETETIYEEASTFFAGEMENVFRHGRLQEAALARIPRDERLRWLAGLEDWAKSKLRSFGVYWEGAGIMLVPLVARSCIEHGKSTEASLWYEALGWLHGKNHRSAEAVVAFRQALEDAQGLRRLVLQRLITDLEAYAGEPDRACRTAQEALAEAASAQVQAHPPATPEAEVADWDEHRVRLADLINDPLAAWYEISLPEASLALQLSYAQVLIRMGNLKQAEAVFAHMQPYFTTLAGKHVPALYIRWANQWCYFLVELQGNTDAAEAAFEQLRRMVDISDPALETERISFVGTGFNIALRLGRYDRAKALAEEMLHLAHKSSNLRQEARAWNSLGITLVSMGVWSQATLSYERSLRLARSIGDRRLEVISLHNLGLSYMDQARYAEARQCQEEYLAISRTTGNHMAEAYAPLTIAVIAMSQGDFAQAEALNARAMRIAEERHWARLVAQSLAQRAELDFYRWLDHPEQPLAHMIVDLSAHEDGWNKLDEAGEYYAALAIATYLEQGEAAANEVLGRARSTLDKSWTTAHMFIQLAQQAIQGQSLEPIQALFREKGFERGAIFAGRVANRHVAPRADRR